MLIFHFSLDDAPFCFISMHFRLRYLFDFADTPRQIFAAMMRF